MEGRLKMKMKYPKMAIALFCGLLLIPMSCEEGTFGEDTLSDDVVNDGQEDSNDEAVGESESITPIADGSSLAPDVKYEIVENESVLLAEINLSETHRITLSIESDDVYTIDETFNLDRDKATMGNSFLALKDSKKMTRTEVYDAVAGETWNEETRRIFQAVDQDLLDKGIGPINFDSEVSPEEESLVTEMGQFDENIHEQLFNDSIPSNIAETNNYTARSGCTPSGFNWESDDGWFKNNCCGNTSKKCLTSGIAPHYSGASRRVYNSSWIIHWGFAQAFCNQARFFISRTRHGPFGWTSYSVIRDLILSPRQAWGTECSGEEGDTEWYMKVQHYSGSDFARVAQACHY
jgi:hypothetical protein